jgi:thioredoxin reductase
MTTEHPENAFDVIVIGGSYAGLSAAMQVARARQRVLVIDAGRRRNRFAASSHGFLGQDGRSPDAIAADGRAQLLAYPNVRWLEDTAVHAETVNDGFTVDVAGGQRFHGRCVVLATGVIDELPDVEGLAERWGRSVFHCPYCHGYELNQGRIGVLAIGPASLHHAMMLPDWGEVTFFLNDSFVPDDAQCAALSARGVAIEPERVVRIVETATVELADGRHIVLDGLFTATHTRMASPIAEQLGCTFEDGPMGQIISTDFMKATSVPGVFACGDAARMGGNVAIAVGDGAMAGVAAHRSLLLG